MSEFKYACPVCGQHIKCDSSQAGTVMDCPTCFQKITVPQAPATDDQKFIITGTKVGDRPPSKLPEANPYLVREAKGFSGAVVVLLILLFIGVAVGFVYRGTIFKPAGPAAPTNQVSTTAGGGKPAAPRKRGLVAPPASDTNWVLSLDGMAIPRARAAGRIHGHDFIVERANFNNGTLTLREGARGPLTNGISINFNGASAETLSGQTINVTTNVAAAARIVLHWQADDDAGQDDFSTGYALRLEFGTYTNNRMAGKIYLCTPDDEKSYLMGTFNAAVARPKPKVPKT